MIRTEGELLAAHLAGDPLAFEELVDRLTSRLWSAARGVLASPEDAEEAIQDALLRAHRSAPSFRGECSVATWVTRILVNICRDRLRSDRRRPSVPLPAHSIDDLLGARVTGSRDAVADLETRLDVWTALDLLPVDQRLPIVLVAVHGYPVGAVAEMLGVPVGTVKSRCSRGRARLQGLLESTHRDVEEAAR